MNFPKIAPSLMCMDLKALKSQIDFLNDKVGYYHVDIMDGHFVPNLTLSPFFVSQIKDIVAAPMDCHLMVTDPQNYISSLAEAGAAMVSFHAETVNGQAYRIIKDIQDHGMKVGVVINPETRLEEVAMYLGRMDKVTLMTVDPGFAGQPFIPEVVEKIKQFCAFREENNLSFEIEIDGSCNKNTYKTLIESGADVLIVGSSGLFGLAPDVSEAWAMMAADIQAAMAGVTHE